MPVPANQTALTAMVIAALPFSVTQDVGDQPSTLQLWYTYTAIADDRTVGVVPYADITSPYLPRLSVFTGPAAAPVAYKVTNSPQRSVYVPVVPGTVYLWKVTQGGATSPVGASLTFKAESGPTDTWPADALLATEENFGWPATILSGETDALIYSQLPGFPTATTGASLANGTIAVVDPQTLQTVLFDASLSQIYTGQPYFAYDSNWISSDTTSLFYLTYQPNSTVPLTLRTLTSVGGLTADVWTLPADSNHASAGAPSRDGTIFYYGGDATGAVHRYDLVTHLALSDLAGAIASYTVAPDLLVAADGSIIVNYRGVSGYQIKRYSSAGATLNTYSFPGDQVHHIALSYTNPLTFWAWVQTTFSSPSHCVFRRLLIADGSTVSEAAYDLFAAGPDARSYDPLYPSIDDVPLFGPAPTCTFFPLTTAPPASGTIIVIKTTVPAGSLQGFPILAGGGLVPASFTLHDGESQPFLHLTPSAGYTVAEPPVANWSTGIVVSNGDDPGNISVDADETVTVTVTNTIVNVPAGGCPVDFPAGHVPEL